MPLVRVCFLAAEKYKYKANQAARRLATGVAEAVGHLMPSKTGSIAEPFIVHGRAGNSDNYAWYDVDSECTFFTLVEHLVCLGHSRIGFIGAPPYFNFSQMRLDGYKDGLAKNGIAFDDSLVEFAEMSDSAGERAAICLLGLNNPPTGILCATDTQAIGVLAAIRSNGLVPGRDISVIGYDGLAIGKHTNPPLTTMVQPLTNAGRQIGDMLLAIIDGGDPKDFQKLQSAEFVRRMSDGPRPILN